MTIGRNILLMSPDELAQFVTERRALRAQSAVEGRTKKKRPQTVSKLAAELGVDVNRVLATLDSPEEK